MSFQNFYNAQPNGALVNPTSTPSAPDPEPELTDRDETRARRVTARGLHCHCTRPGSGPMDSIDPCVLYLLWIRD